MYIIDLTNIDNNKYLNNDYEDYETRKKHCPSF